MIKNRPGLCAAETAEIFSRMAEITNQVNAGRLSSQQLQKIIEGKNYLDYSVVDIGVAAEIMGKNNFYGPDAIFKVLNTTIYSGQVPQIPFPQHELEQASKDNMILILRIDYLSDAKPLTMLKLINYCLANYSRDQLGVTKFSTIYDNYAFYFRDTPRFGWCLVSRDRLPADLGNGKINYSGQTELMVNHLYKKAWTRGLALEYQEAITEFESQKASINSEESWGNRATRLTELLISLLCRRTPIEALYDHTIVRLTTGEELLLGRELEMTNCRHHNGTIVNLSCYSGPPSADTLYIDAQNPVNCNLLGPIMAYRTPLT